MKYFQTDDRDDYFASMRSEPVSKKVTLINSKGVIVLNDVDTGKVRWYYKNKYCGPAENGKRVWREKLTELGYKIKRTHE